MGYDAVSGVTGNIPPLRRESPPNPNTERVSFEDGLNTVQNDEFTRKPAENNNRTKGLLKLAGLLACTVAGAYAGWHTRLLSNCESSIGKFFTAMEKVIEPCSGAFAGFATGAVFIKSTSDTENKNQVLAGVAGMGTVAGIIVLLSALCKKAGWADAAVRNAYEKAADYILYAGATLIGYAGGKNCYDKMKSKVKQNLTAQNTQVNNLPLLSEQTAPDVSKNNLN